MAKVTELELKGIIHSEINNAIGFMGSNLSAQRRKSLEYYMGDKLGTEIDGRSQVVSTDVADTIETILPNLLRIFTSSDQVVRCEPVKSEDVELADQATNYINYIFNKDNAGFSILYTWFKDALLEISKESENPHHIRIKALNSLKELADQSVVDEMLLMLQDKNNYKYYNEIISLVKSVGDESEVKENLRKVAFQAMQNDKGDQ